MKQVMQFKFSRGVCRLLLPFSPFSFTLPVIVPNCPPVFEANIVTHWLLLHLLLPLLPPPSLLLLLLLGSGNSLFHLGRCFQHERKRRRRRRRKKKKKKEEKTNEANLNNQYSSRKLGNSCQLKEKKGSSPKRVEE